MHLTGEETARHRRGHGHIGERLDAALALGELLQDLKSMRMREPLGEFGKAGEHGVLGILA